MGNQNIGNEKAQKFAAYLSENEIACFGRQDAEDEFHSAVFRSKLEVSGQEMPFVLLTDSSIYTMLQVRVVAGAVKEENFTEVAKEINALNARYKMFKYAVSSEGDLLLTICIPSTAEHFDAVLVNAVMEEMLKHLTEVYPALMSKVWAK